MFSARTVSWLAAIAIGIGAWVYIVKSPPPATPDARAAVDHSHSAHPAGAPATSSVGPPVPIITTTFDNNGVLYAAEARGMTVTVSTSRDAGAAFSAPVVLTPEPESPDADGEARPKVVIGQNGEVLVSWTRKGQALHTGDIRFARSTDGGRTFSVPTTINDDGLAVGHRFDSLGVAPDGTVTLAWVDNRDLDRASRTGADYVGAAVYIATSSDGGGTFTANRKVKDHSCECCRLAMAFDADSTPVLFWRDVLPGGIRDHVVVRVTAGDAPVASERVGHENWVTDACPHHGPALAIAPSQRYHFAWFTGAESTGSGVFYAHSDDRGKTTSPPVRLGTGGLAGHPSMVSTRDGLWLAWKEWRDDGGTAVLVMRSQDDGATWSAAREVATAPGSSDRPFLLARGDAVLLSWTDPRGLRVLPVSPSSLP